MSEPPVKTSKNQTVQRWDCYYPNSIGDEYGAFCRNREDGEWVKFEDYEALTTRLTQAEANVARLGKINEGLVSDFNTLLVDGSKKDSDNEWLRAALLKAKRSHYSCEDPWYQCPKHPEGCANSAEGTDCNCGADDFNAEIDRILLGDSFAPETTTQLQKAKELVAWLPITTEELIRLRNANKITFDKQVSSITTVLIQLRELFAGSSQETTARPIPDDDPKSFAGAACIDAATRAEKAAIECEGCLLGIPRNSKGVHYQNDCPYPGAVRAIACSAVNGPVNGEKV